MAYVGLFGAQAQESKPFAYRDSAPYSSQGVLLLNATLTVREGHKEASDLWGPWSNDSRRLSLWRSKYIDNTYFGP